MAAERQPNAPRGAALKLLGISLGVDVVIGLELGASRGLATGLVVFVLLVVLTTLPMARWLRARPREGDS